MPNYQLLRAVGGAFALLLTTAVLHGQEIKPLWIDGTLTKKDPLDKVRTSSHYKVHELTLKVGEIYLLDLVSTEFDTFLRLEDAGGVKISENDDISDTDLNSRLGFVPKKTGTYRAIVTTFEGGITGKYQLRVHTLKKAGQPKVIQGKITDKSRKDKAGRFVELHKIDFKADEVWLIDLTSREFDPFLMVANAKGKVVGFDDDGGEGLNSRLVLQAASDGQHVVQATSFAKAETGEYELRLQKLERTTTIDKAEWSKSKPIPGIGGKIRFNDDCSRNTLADYATRGKATWEAGAFKFMAGAGMSRNLQGGPVLDFILDLDFAPLAKDGDQAETWVAFTPDSAESFGLSTIAAGEPVVAVIQRTKKNQQISAEIRIHKLASLERGIRDQFPGAVVRQFNLTGDLAKTPLRFRYQHGLLLVQQDGKDLAIGYAENYCANIKAATVFQRSGALAIKSLRLEGDAEPKLPPFDQRLKLLLAAADDLRSNELQTAGRYEEALKPALGSLRICEEVLGNKHFYTLRARHRVADIHDDLRNDAEAMRLQKEVVEFEREVLGEKHPDFSVSLDLLGLLYSRKGDLKKAESLFQQALEIDRQVLGEKHLEFTKMLARLGDNYFNQENHAKAEQYYLQSLDIRKITLGPKYGDYADALLSLGNLYHSLGMYAKAEPYCKEAVEIHKATSGDKHANHARALGLVGMIYQAQGRLPDAEKVYQQVIDIRKATVGEKHPQFAEALYFLAAVHQTKGNYANSESLLRRVLEIEIQTIGKCPSYATSLEKMGYQYELQGDFSKAESYFREALEIRKTKQGEKHLDYANGLSRLAHLYRQNGDLVKAEDYYVKALACYRVLKLVEGTDFAAAQSGFGILRNMQKDFKAAERLMRESMEIRRKSLGEDHPYFANSLVNVGVTLTRLGEYDRAEKLLLQALAIRKKWLGEKHADYARVLNHLGVNRHGMGDFAKAAAYFESAARFNREVLEESAVIQSERQQLAHVNLLFAGFSNLIELGKYADTTSSAYDLALAWKGSVTTRQRLLRLARAEVNDPESMQLLEKLPRISQQISALHAMPAESMPKGFNLKNRLAELTSAREEIEAQLVARTQAYRKLKDNQKLSTKGLQSHLPDGAVLIDFIEYGRPPFADDAKETRPQMLVAFVLTKDRIERVDLGVIGPVKVAVEAFRQGIKTRTAPVMGKDDPALVLREKLLDPLEKHWAGAKVLLISPSGPLCRLPFGTLPGKDRKKYLIEEISIAIVPVPRLLPELVEAVDQPKTSALLVLGDVDFGPPAVDAKRRWPRLPGTIGEMEAIERTFQKAVPKGSLNKLAGDMATASNFRAKASQHQYLHLATHGYFAPREMKQLHVVGAEIGGPQENPHIVGYPSSVLSGLVLAGANRTNAGNDDGILTALEVGDLDLGNVRLAVLSACETGLGETAGGEGVLGLQRAFHTAGAKTVVTSLWSVHDGATMLLMEEFYANLWQRKLSKLDALREAQLFVLRNPKRVEERTRVFVKELQSRGVTEADMIERGILNKAGTVNAATSGQSPPAHWAAFVLSGHWK